LDKSQSGKFKPISGIDVEAEKEFRMELGLEKQLEHLFVGIDEEFNE
jgi:hypothetical protein